MLFGIVGDLDAIVAGAARGIIWPGRVIIFFVEVRNSTSSVIDISNERLGMNLSTWIFTFEKTVTRCHQVGDMTYPQLKFYYADYLSKGLAHANAICEPPSRWQRLPVASPNIPDRIITGTEHERYATLAVLLPDSQKNRVILLVDAVNEHQHHIPVTVSPFAYVFVQFYIT